MFAAEFRRNEVDRMCALHALSVARGQVYVKINGEMHYLWRAVDYEGES